MADLPADRTRDRAAMMNQLMLAGTAVLLTALVAVGAFPGDRGEFIAGVVLILAGSALALLVPWNRVPLVWMAIIPVLDIVAIGVLRISSPGTGVGVLWVFPAMWLSGSFGPLGFGAVAAACVVMLVVALLLDPLSGVTYLPVLLPILVFVASGVTYLTARRAAAQRVLLGKQAQLLGTALERTRRQEQELIEMLEAVDFGVVRIAADGSTVITNDAHGRLQNGFARRGIDAETSVFQDDGVTPLPDDELPLARALRGEAFDRQLVWFGEPDGARSALSVTVRRLTDTTGADAGAVMISRDVTAELSALHSRDELVASVSHELRTPLTSILGYLDLALDDPTVPPAARHGLEIAERNAERLLSIVADILENSRRPTGRTSPLTVVPEDVDAARIVLASAESMLPRAAERAVQIDTAGVAPLRVHADPARLRQVMDNLIANAIKYNRDGGSVALSTRRDGDDALIAVADTGVGVSETDRRRLFRPFFRGSAAEATRTPGTGLGLAISQQIMRAHGGEIGVAPAAEEGTVFTVRLPAPGPGDDA